MSGDSAGQDLVLVTGLSGGGKSTALNALEDLGYFCVDNLPAALLREFARTVQGAPSRYPRIGLGIDARSSERDLEEIPGWLDELSSRGLNYQLIFLDADARAILKRFSETRRRHPLTTDNRPLPQAIEREKDVLERLRRRADWVIDTSDTNIHQLRRQVWKCVGGDNDSMTVVLESFAFKRGVPQDVDFIFDARILPNPHWIEELRDLTGLDGSVSEWLEKDDSVRGMLGDILSFLRSWLPAFRRSQRSYVTVGVGCTGGRHRSVYLVDRLAEGLQPEFGTVLVHHRELQG
jgi:UPF0042 nucleotide-binding protein